MSQPLIRLSDVSFNYHDGPPILDHVNLDVPKGARIGLVGPTGGGKTTILRLIVGLIRPTSGQVEVLGKARTTEESFAEVRRKVQLLFQDPEDQLFSPTVLEDVAFGPLNTGKSREESIVIAQETLASLGLNGYEDKITHKLSGGQKRLVSLAAVLAMKPDALLLDEPENGLDEESVKRLVDILWGLPLTMIVVSHHRNFLERVVTTGLVVRKGAVSPWKEKTGAPEKAY